MKTYYIVHERDVLGGLCYKAYSSKFNFFFQIPVSNTITWISKEECINKLKQTLKSTKFKKIIVDTINL
jgi:hypothetical protein